MNAANPTRRTMLAAGVSATFLAACSSGSKHDGGATVGVSSSASGNTGPGSGSGLGASSQAPAAANWQELAGSLDGKLLLPNSPGFVGTHALFDPDFDANKPAAVIQVKSADDVQKAVKYGAAHGIRITARSGGHSYIGASAAAGALVIDLRALDSLSYDPRQQSATIGAGKRLYDIHTALNASGRTIPTGTCPTVGVSGLTAGGGLGVSSRTYGLTCDSVIGADVVLPNGDLVHADSRTHSDILWALKGAGGGFVGIVTRWTFTTFAAARSGSFIIDFPTNQPQSVLMGWGSWVQSAPRSQWANLHISDDGSGISLRAVGITADGEQDSAAAALIKACGGTSTHVTTSSRSHMQTVEFLGGGATSARTSFTAGSDILAKLDAEVASAIIQAVSEGPSGVTAVLDPLTGAVADVSASATAFGWRRHLASIQWYSGSTGQAARAWLSSAHDALNAHSSGRYLNYIEHSGDFSTYLGANADRAKKLRAQYDPKNILVTSLEKTA